VTPVQLVDLRTGTLVENGFSKKMPLLQSRYANFGSMPQRIFATAAHILHPPAP
jgi:hypothetical protein